MSGEDRWAHRSDTMRCQACMYFVPKVVAVAAGEADQVIPSTGLGEPIYAKRAQSDVTRVPSQLGRCRRHAPTLAGWPAVFQDDWCGDHRLDENKIGPA